jgi:hypothetical protein
LKQTFLLKIAFLLIILSACSISNSPTTTLIPPNPAITPIPTFTSTPTQLPVSTIAPTEAIRLFPLAQIQIFAPVELLPVTSPFQLNAKPPDNYSGPVEIELKATDGRLLAKSVFQLDQDDLESSLLNREIIFEISGQEENGRLSISIFDDYDRLLALSSVDLHLLSSGSQESFAEAEYPEKIWIRLPETGSQQQNGPILISGLGFPKGERPYSVQIINREGRILDFGEAYPDFSSENDFATFEITLEVNLENSQNLQIAVRESGTSLSGDIHFSSIEIELVPE